MELKSLGRQVEPKLSGADATLLERVANPTFKYKTSFVTIIIKGDEFTSLCPVTNQPDFGEITIEYEPHNWIVESKSLKLYLGSYRNEGIFHEAISAKICRDLAALLQPRHLKVQGNFKPRGGWAIQCVAHYFNDGSEAAPHAEG